MFSYEQFKTAADELDWQVAMVSALTKKEVTDKPYFTVGGKKRQKILFERHKYWRHLVKRGIDPVELIRKDPTLRDILGTTPYPTSQYGKYTRQYQRRDRAATICAESALAACSYTGFQILGENYAECGYESVSAFVQAMDDEANWLAAMVALVKSKGIVETLQPHRLDFAAFAEKWNGPDYWRAKYDQDLGRIYQRELAAILPKPESKLAAVVQSGTIQRTGAAVTAAAAPAAPLLLEGANITDLISQVQGIADQGKSVAASVGDLHQQAAAITEQLGWVEWLPWMAGGWTVLLVLVFAAVAQRYLHDRGYV